VKTNKDRDARFTRLFEAHASRLHAYARRHAGRDGAEDLVADAFSVALRRLDEVPDGNGESLAWLIGTVRKLAANQRRRQQTQDRHWREAVRDAWHASHTASPEDAVAERERCLAALARLSDADREVLLLVAWEGLTAEQAATALGISRNAFGVRLHRARQRLLSDIQPTYVPELRAATTEGLS
jgi:RNA polymerase sigma factor (sigma-70 family)